MIPMVEDYLQDLMTTKFQNLRDNPSLTAKVLETTPERMSKLQNFLSQGVVKIIKGYPRTPADLPCVVILLAEEDEEQMGLGDVADDDAPTVSNSIDTVEVLEDIRMDNPYYIKLPNVPLDSIFTLYNEDLGQEVQSYTIEDYGRGIVSVSAENEPGDMITATYTYGKSVVINMETKYTCNYRLEVWTPNGDLTVQLYHLVKWTLLSGRDTLVDTYGLFRQKLGGSDFEPAPSYFPEFVYRRALTFWCETSVSVPVDELEYISDIQVNQTISFDDGSGGGI